MLTKNRRGFSFFATVFLVGLTFGFIIQLSFVCSSFLSITAGDILQAVAQLGSASVIAWVVFKLQSKSTRINDIKLRAFEKYLDRIDVVRNKVDHFISCPSPSLKTDILFELREASNELALLKDINHRSSIEGFDYHTVFGHYVAFKGAITSGSFAAKSPTFSNAEIKLIRDKYLEIRRHLIFLRIDNGT